MLNILVTINFLCAFLRKTCIAHTITSGDAPFVDKAKMPIAYLTRRNKLTHKYFCNLIKGGR